MVVPASPRVVRRSPLNTSASMADLQSRLAAAEGAVAAAEAELQRLRDEAATARKGTARVARVEGRRATSSEIMRHLRRDGVVAVERLAPPEQMEALAGELAALEPYAYRGEPGSFAGAGTARNGSYLIASCPTSQQLALHPLLTEVAEALLAPYARRIALAVASEIRVEGSSPAQVLHRDDHEWPLDLLAMKRPGAGALLHLFAPHSFPHTALRSPCW